MRLILRAAALAEAREARLWYASRSSVAANRFMTDLEAALATICEAPHRWAVVGGARRYVMRPFPFMIIYRVANEVVDVIAVSHTSRRPGR